MGFADAVPAPVPTYQSLAELAFLWEYVAVRPHATVVEVGSLFGGTLWYWSQLPAIATLVSVDLRPVGFLPEAVEARTHWHEWFDARCRFVEVEADSHDPATVSQVQTSLDAPVDFLFIDADHRFEGVQTDFERWSPLVHPGGVVAFHDTWPNKNTAEPGVVQFVDNLRYFYPSTAWTAPDGAGITAFTMPGTP